MSKSMIAVLTAIITAVVSVCSTLVIVKNTDVNGTQKESQVEIHQGDEGDFQPYDLVGGQQTVEGDTSMYKVDIKSARISVDTEVDGEPADVKSVLVTFSYTNNSSEPDYFSSATDCHVYQNGVALEDASSGVYDIRNDDSIEYSDIKPGTTLEFEIGFNLNDETSDLVVEVVNGSSLDPEFLVSRTFTLS